MLAFASSIGMFVNKDVTSNEISEKLLLRCEPFNFSTKVVILSCDIKNLYKSISN